MSLLAALSTLLGPSPVAVARDVGTGVATGLPLMAVAGPVSLLLVDVGMRRGLRAGSPAAFGVAFGDVVAAMGVTLFGTAVGAVIRPIAPWFRLLSATLLVGFAAHVLWQMLSERRERRRDVEAPALLALPGVDIVDAPRTRLFGGFVGITMANPMTILVYVGLVVGGGAGSGTFGWAIGMGAASLLAHGGYLGLGHAAGATMSPAALRGLRVVAVVLLVGFAVHLFV